MTCYSGYAYVNGNTAIHELAHTINHIAFKRPMKLISLTEYGSSLIKNGARASFPLWLNGYR